eukprot:CAMPEP_0194084464 /NCGR_PEP_ID=MMETSP0149-20130528/13490_1 /TAXON_ID=122233 /ORGANISM="Chaetoceros debilis, Strain MM31A-1" /LENGTH=579 /DNA_ID=CAMNT_0038767127 /DNA_START=44 /DNA_END=1780 /DNA_ORIENTATION=-
MVASKRISVVGHSSSQDKKRAKRRIQEIEKEAAIRTLNGNGQSPNLPPLPKEDDGKGLGTLFSHPYGALPFGNIFLASSDAVRHNGLGDIRPLNDEQVLSVMQFLDAEALARTAETSRFLYVAAHHDELWRDVTLRKYGSNGFDFKASWKDTYSLTQLKTDKNEIEFISHKPIAMKGIYSDTFFRSWLCRSFALQESWLAVENVCTEKSDELTLDKFLTDYEEKNIPLIVKGATSSWPASKKWNKSYLTKETQGVTFRATSGAAPLPAKFNMKSYADYCDSATEEAPLYLFDRTFSQTCPKLLSDFAGSLKSSCPFFDDDAAHGHDLFSLLGNGKRPDHRWIIIGPKRSGSSFHIDPNATHAWNAPIKGSKRWIFYPPGVSPPGVYPSPSGDDVIMPISLGEWYLSHWNDHVKQRKNPVKSKRPLECTVHPGDILFVPHGWWHCVLNLDDGMSIALTQNYVSASNLPDVLRFLKTRNQQISGCRDRADAIQPDKILDKLKERLQEKYPDLLKKAQHVAEEGWQCAAWADIEDNGPKKKTKTSVLERARMFSENTGSSTLSEEKKDGDEALNRQGNGGFS